MLRAGATAQVAHEPGDWLPGLLPRLQDKIGGSGRRFACYKTVAGAAEEVSEGRGFYDDPSRWQRCESSQKGLSYVSNKAEE